MKFILNKNFKAKRGDLFPIFEFSNLSGEKQDWNDFQWWAPTKNFNDWLKKNPREWQAESLDNDVYSIYTILESEYKRDMEALKEEERFSFDYYVDSVYEDRDIAGSIEDSKKSKEYIKFIYALNKANNEGKISENFLAESAAGSDSALILSLPDSAGKRIDGTDFAIKVKGTKTSGSIIIFESDEMIPGGKIPDDASFRKMLVNFGNFTGEFLKSAIVPTMAVVGVAMGGKLALRYLAKLGINSITGATKTAKAASKSRGFFQMFKLQLGTKKGPVLYRFAKNAIAARKSGKNFTQSIKAGVSAIKAARTYAKNASGVGKTAKAASSAATLALNAIGIGEIIMLAQGIQQTYNWFSKNQAPRFGEIEDKVPGVSSVFNPGSIKDGEAITVCWTQEAGSTSMGGAIKSFLISSDTRTTMDLVKIGNFEGKAVFVLASIKSQQFSKALSGVQMILLAFKEGSNFKHGYLDNDDLEFEMIQIKDINSISIPLIFEGMMDWGYFSGNYASSSTSIMTYDKKAPEKYEFNFKDNEGEIVNIKGILVKSENEIKRILTSGGKVSGSESGSGKDDKEGSSEKGERKTDNEYKSIFQGASNQNDNDSGVSFVRTAGDRTPEAVSDSVNFRVKGFSEFIFEEEEAETKEVGAKEDSKNLLTGPGKFAVYTVEESKYAEKGSTKKYDSIESFIVPPKYYNASEGEKIDVETSNGSEDKIEDAKKGTVSITSKETEVSGEEKKTGDEVEKLKKSDSKEKEEQVKTVDRGEKGVGVSKIKDKDKKDDWNPSQYLSDAEKSELGVKDWEDGVRKVKIYRDDNGKPTMVKIKSYNRLSTEADERKKVFREDDPGFEKAVEFAERVEKGSRNQD